MAKHSSTTKLNHNIATLITLLITTLLIIPTSSTSRIIPSAAKSPPINGFRIELARVSLGNNNNLTKLQRLSRRIKTNYNYYYNNNSVFHRLDQSSTVEAPIRPGNGEFLMKLSIGTPSREFSAIMDTGSDLTWTQCLPCTDCFKQETPIFDPSNSTSFSRLPCQNPLCKSLPSSSCNDDDDDKSSYCEYLYAYGDYSSTQGVIASETFSFGDEKEDVFHEIVFGCGSDNDGEGFQQAAGLVGLGRGPLSLVSQLKQKTFSYCLTDETDPKKTSSLMMGNSAEEARVSENGTKIVTTKLVKNPAQPSFYYLDLRGISVGGVRLDLDEDVFSVREDGSGGLIIDSGTTITYLEKPGFRALRDEFVKQMSLSVDDSLASKVGLDLCFSLPEGSGNVVEVPKLVLHFGEGSSSDLELPAENYILSDSEMGLVCLAMGPSTGMSILGNVQQQNMLVVHDLHKETLSFVPTQCDQL